MSLRKYAAAQVLAVAPAEGLRAQAHRAVFSFVPRAGYLYVRSRSISSRCNDNYDYFGPEEIAKSYRTFIGKPVFVNHNNHDHRRARGMVIDAVLHRDRNPDGSPDVWCETLMEVDAKTYPKLAKAILAGDVDRTSMGCDVELSKCSVCGNEATSPLEYCQHIPGQKGKRIYRMASNGQREGQLVYEVCSGLKFFENSLLVEQPADPTAFFLGQPVVGPGLEHLHAKAANLRAALNERPAGPPPTVALPSASSLPPFSSTAPRSVQHIASNGHVGASGDDWSVGMSEERRRKAEEVGSKLWEGMHQIFDPGSNSESRKSDRNSRVMNALQNNGYQPHHIRFNENDDDHPYGHIEGRGGWYVRDHSGPHLEIMHHATGAEAHDMINLQHHDPETRSQHRAPGYGPAEAEQDLHHWTDGDPQETGGAAQYLEQTDPRIRRWQQRHQASLQVQAAPRPKNLVFNDLPQKFDPYHNADGTHVDDMDDKDFKSHTRAVSKAMEAHGRSYGYKRDKVAPAAYIAPKKVEDMNRSELSLHNARRGHVTGMAKRWIDKNPATEDNIRSSFDGLSEADRKNGTKWYETMHNLSRTLADAANIHRESNGHAPITHHHMLGLLSTYSPQTEWHWNIHAALAAATDNKGYGLAEHGTGGFKATKSMGAKAEAIMKSRPEDIESLFNPDTARKTMSFVHNGSYPHESQKVTVDRQEARVQHAGRIPDYAFNHGIVPLLGNKAGYDPYEKRTQNVAADLNRERGTSYLPHHLQGGNWIGVQRSSLDEAKNDAKGISKAKRNASLSESNRNRLLAYAEEHHPQYAEDLRSHLSGVSGWTKEAMQRLAYGETVAPQDVDTLRDERCAICGNDTAYDGRECLVCGYLAPPKALGDPDVDKAKRLDELKQSVDDALLDVDPSRQGADFDPGDTDAIQAEEGEEVGPSTLGCPACGTEFPSAPPTTEDAIPGQEQEGPEEGDPCPACGKGILESTGQPEDVGDAEALDEDGEPGDEQDAAEDEAEGGLPGEQDPDDPDAVDVDDDDDDEDDKKKRPAVKRAATSKYQHPLKGIEMQKALAALAELQALVEYQQHENRKLSARLASKDSQIQRLTYGLQAIAQYLGPDVDTLVRSAMLRKRADEQNPAQPVPEPAPEPATQSTPEVETPEAMADVNAPGMVPGSNQDVAADAVTTAYTPGQDVGANPVRNLVDVTRPVDGTQGPRPLSETKTNVDVRVGNPMNPQTAFPLSGPFAQPQRTGSANGDAHAMAAIRLARLRIATGEQGDDLALGQKIASEMDPNAINAEIATLNGVLKRTASRQSGPNGAQPPRGAVPRAAPGVGRTTPSLTSQAGLRTHSVQRDDDSDLALIFLGEQALSN